MHPTYVWLLKRSQPAGPAISSAVRRSRPRYRGIPAGAAIPTTRGAVIAAVEAQPLALLEYVPGDELTEKNTDDVRLVGTNLGRVHLALRDTRVDGARSLFEICCRAVGRPRHAKPG